MNIAFRNPKHPDIYAPVINTDSTDVEITECFGNLRFITADGEVLTVCMRDSGFEIGYKPNNYDDLQWFSLKGGTCTPDNAAAKAGCCPENDDCEVETNPLEKLFDSLITDLYAAWTKSDR